MASTINKKPPKHTPTISPLPLKWNSTLLKIYETSQHSYSTHSTTTANPLYLCWLCSCHLKIVHFSSTSTVALWRKAHMVTWVTSLANCLGLRHLLHPCASWQILPSSEISIPSSQSSRMAICSFCAHNLLPSHMFSSFLQSIFHIQRY